MEEDTIELPNSIHLDEIGSTTDLDQVSTNRKKYVNHQYVNFQYVDFEETSSVSRAEWANKVEFILSIIGYAVGLGNIWRFPYLAYRHGGGTFLVPYLSMLLCIGLPLFFMELALGQYAGQGPTKIFGKIAPISKGLGFAMLLVAFLVSIYYNMIIAWSIFYLGNSFFSELPWTVNGTKSSHFFYNAVLGIENEDHSITSTSWIGDVKWELCISLFSAWSLVCICLINYLPHMVNCLDEKLV